MPGAAGQDRGPDASSRLPSPSLDPGGGHKARLRREGAAHRAPDPGEREGDGSREAHLPPRPAGSQEPPAPQERREGRGG